MTDKPALYSRSKCYAKAIIREWKIPTLGAAAWGLSKFISHSDVVLIKWISVISTHLIPVVIAIHFIALFFYPEPDVKLTEKDKEKLKVYLDKNFDKAWITVAFSSGVASMIFLVVAFYKLLTEQERIIISAPYLCASVFFFGLFISVKDSKFSKTAMTVGVIGIAITSVVLMM